MSMDLCMDELERLEEDIADDNFRGIKYLDTWDYEDEYSHNDIEIARKKFIEMANDFFQQNDLPYMMREVCENAMVCDKDTREILYQQKAI